MARVNVHPRMLEWAIARSGREEYIYTRMPMVSAWIQGEKQPTLKQLQSFAKATYIPLGYLFLTEPPSEELPVPHFRTLSTDEDLKPSPNLMETIKTMEKRQSWMRDYLIEKGQDHLSFVGSVSDKENPVEVAQQMKMKLGIKDTWASECKTWEEALKFLFNKVEQAGILVMISGIVGANTKRKLDVNEFRGFVLIDEYAPLIFINGSDSKAAQMFTFAHELAHVWYGKSGIFDLANLQPADDQTELACDRTAAEFLVPFRLFLEQWELNNESENRFNDLAKFFKVSEIVIARRALDLSLIPKEAFFDFYQEYQERLEKMKANRGSGGDYYNTQRYNTSENFARAVVSSANSGEILYNEAYRLTDMSPKAFTKFSELVESY